MALVKCNPQNTLLFLFFQTNPSLFVTVTAQGSDGLTVNISRVMNPVNEELFAWWKLC